MKKIILLLVLFAVQSGYSQNAKIDFTSQQIDSIANVTGRSGIAEGHINSQKQVVREDKKKVVNGEGQSTVTIYKYNSGKYSRLIKGEYRRNIRYEDKSSEEVFAHFYYNEKQLFLIRLTEIIKDAKGETTKDHDIDVSKMNELQAKDYLFTENIQKWISQVDASMINMGKKRQ